MREMTHFATVKAQLLQVAGVSPSNRWLEDCILALQCSSLTETFEAVLDQILHHDLRDVVRTFDMDEAEVTCPAAAQLRRAVVESQSEESRKVILPPSFRLLVQVEEFLSVSGNAETRLAVGPSSSAPTGNQHNRCLKVCYADGYCGGISRYIESVGAHPLVALEVSPIGAMSANSLAGLKLLLTGPVTIRHGIAGWHAGNATVLGGCVESLVLVQHQALQLAKQRAGHGVDPTVKALIWNHQQPQDDEDGTRKESIKSPLWSSKLFSYLIHPFVSYRSLRQMKEKVRVPMFPQRHKLRCLCSSGLHRVASSRRICHLRIPG